MDKRYRKGRDHPNTKHGYACTPTFCCWQNMMRRCYNQEYGNYRFYGGRGIRVCEKLRGGVLNFVEVIGVKPPDLQLDRIDNDGHYSCGDCDECKSMEWAMNLKWSTRKEQCRNRRNSVMVNRNGQVKTVAEWAELDGLPHHTVYNAVKLELDPERFGVVTSAKWKHK